MFLWQIRFLTTGTWGGAPGRQHQTDSNKKVNQRRPLSISHMKSSTLKHFLSLFLSFFELMGLMGREMKRKCLIEFLVLFANFVKTAYGGELIGDEEKQQNFQEYQNVDCWQGETSDCEIKSKRMPVAGCLSCFTRRTRRIIGEKVVWKSFFGCNRLGEISDRNEFVDRKNFKCISSKDPMEEVTVRCQCRFHFCNDEEHCRMHPDLQEICQDQEEIAESDIDYYDAATEVAIDEN